MPQTFIRTDQISQKATFDDELLFSVASGIKTFSRKLSLSGDFTNGSLLTFNNIPYLRLLNNQNDFVTWNIITPNATSGIKCIFYWAPDINSLGSLNHELKVSSLFEGDNITEPQQAISSLNLNQSFSVGEIYKNEILINFPILLNKKSINIKFTRMGAQDTVVTNSNILSFYLEAL